MPEYKHMRSLPRSFYVQVFFLFAAYAITARAGLLLGAVSGFATFVWPPTGIALAALLVYGYRLWPGVFLAAFLVNFITGAPVAVAAGIAVGNTLEAVVGAFLLRRFGWFKPSLRGVSDVLVLIGYAALGSTLVSATIGVSSLYLGGTLAGGAIGPTWVAWWVGDILGNLVAFPFALVILGRLRFRFDKKQRVEACALALFLILASLVVFNNLTAIGSIGHSSLAYLLFLPLIWAALRFDQATVATAIFATSALAVWGTVGGLGPFAGGTLSESLFVLQLFMGTMAVTSLLMGAAVAERRRGALELEERAVEDEALIESIGDGVIAVDPQGRILKTNTQARSMLGWDALPTVGVELATTLETRDERGASVPPALRPLNQALHTGKRITTDRFSYARRDGSTFPAAITVSPITFAGETIGAVEVFRDITSEREIERAKSQFIALVSHQLRTPLTIASWYSERVRRRSTRLEPKDRRDLGEIERSVHQMIQLVNDILHVSLLESGRLKIDPVPTHLGEFLRRVIQEFGPLVQEKTCHIRFEEPTTVPPVPVDQDLTREILYNLLSNAVHYSRGPRCDVLVSLRQGSGTYEDTYIIAVADRGIGISLADRMKIFQRFFRTEEARKMVANGTGLGLYIVKEIVGAVGADIWVESEQGVGSTFFVAIPKGGMRRRSGEQFSVRLAPGDITN